MAVVKRVCVCILRIAQRWQCRTSFRTRSFFKSSSPTLRLLYTDSPHYTYITMLVQKKNITKIQKSPIYNTIYMQANTGLWMSTKYYFYINETNPKEQTAIITKHYQSIQNSSSEKKNNYMEFSKKDILLYLDQFMRREVLIP